MAIPKIVFFLFMVFAFCLKSQSQTVPFEKIGELQKTERRPVMALIHTDWCAYCGSMKHAMLNNNKISALLNKKFYVVLLDAEEKKAIKFAGRKFQYKPTGKNTGVHELAQQIGNINGQLSYPTICFLNDKNEIIYQHAGYLNPEALNKVLKTVSDIYSK